MVQKIIHMEVLWDLGITFPLLSNQNLFTLKYSNIRSHPQQGINFHLKQPLLAPPFPANRLIYTLQITLRPQHSEAQRRQRRKLGVNRWVIRQEKTSPGSLLCQIIRSHLGTWLCLWIRCSLSVEQPTITWLVCGTWGCGDIVVHTYNLNFMITK